MIERIIPASNGYIVFYDDGQLPQIANTLTKVASLVEGRTDDGYITPDLKALSLAWDHMMLGSKIEAIKKIRLMFSDHIIPLRDAKEMVEFWMEQIKQIKSTQEEVS